MAILYYYKALALRPNDPKILQNLNTALSQQGLPAHQPPNIWEKVLLLKGVLSQPRQLQLFALIGVITLILATIMFWKPSGLCKSLLYLFALAWLFLTLSLGWQKYFSPIEAVIIQSAPLYRDAGEEYAQVQKAPLNAGLKVHVLDISENGKWMKIITPDNTL